MTSYDDARAPVHTPEQEPAFEEDGRTPRTRHDPRRGPGVPVQRGQPVHLPQTRPGPDRGHRRDGRYAIPPSDAEKYWYLQGGQKRWLLVLQYVAFLGVVISFAGFTASSYWTLIFSIPLALFAVEQTLALYTSTRRRRIDLVSHQYTVENWTPRRYPSVDVFVPTADEELDVLNNTMRHLKLLEWPGELHVSILDDSGRFSVRDLAANYEFSYLARPGPEYKKAGNLRYGGEHAHGEIITIFDADFVPRPDFCSNWSPTWTTRRLGSCRAPSFSTRPSRRNGSSGVPGRPRNCSTGSSSRPVTLSAPPSASGPPPSTGGSHLRPLAAFRRSASPRTSTPACGCSTPGTAPATCRSQSARVSQPATWTTSSPSSTAGAKGP